MRVQTSSLVKQLTLLVCTLLQFQTACSVVTCGGFVTTSSQLSAKMNSKLDYSSVKVHLFTDEGLLKYTTECAPNGNYFIPVYDSGSFYLQVEGPASWAFDPTRYNFVVNDEEQGCSEDINFKFTGFGLSGKIVGNEADDCNDRASGPKGVKVTAFEDNDKQTELSSVLSGADGKFSFNNMFPGNYTVVASHPTFNIANSEQKVTVELGNSEVVKAFQVSGYAIHGSVDNAGTAFANVDIFLFSATKKVVNCNSKTSAEVPDKYFADQNFLLCTTQSDSQGKFTFEGVPCGEYQLVPSFKQGSTTFDVIPPQTAVSVSHAATTIAAPFQVSGFSASGRVIDRAGAGVAGAVVFVNGETKGTTDSKGMYNLEKVTAGKYNIEVTKEHTFFSSIKNFELSPSNSALPDISIVKFHVCGRVNSDGIKGTRNIVLKHTQFQLETETDADGRFCVEAVPGDYTVSPVLTSSEIASGLLLSPATRKIMVSNRPLLGIDFVRAQVVVSGSIQCIGQCNSALVKVTLSSQTRDHPDVTVSVEGNRFSLKDVLPGQYKITVRQDSWCWEESSFDIIVSDTDMDDIIFVQNGFFLHSVLSHNIVLNITLDGADYEKSFSLKKGTNRFCLAKPGIYKLVPHSCYRFEEETYTYDTDNPDAIKLTARDYKVNGIVLVDTQASEYSDTRSLALSIKPDKQPTKEITATYSRTSKRSDVEPVCEQGRTDVTSCISAEQGAVKVRVYEYTYWSKPGDNLEIVPPNTDGQSLLFYPRSIQFSLSSRKSCPPPVNTFFGRPGLSLKGSVTPPLAGVEIIVKSASTGSEFLKVTTKADGTYQAGPLHEDEQYSVTAVREGYYFKEEKTGHFRALKFGQIVVSANVDGDQAKPLENVLFSTSSDSFRQTKESGSDGTFSFGNLFPGTYFIRPLLKEYEFEPNSQSIEVTESGTVRGSFKATRVAYSVFGSVFSLNFEPENSVVIEAIQVLKSNTTSDGKPVYSRYEETMTDVNGDYRLRGLLPNSEYKIRIKAGKGDQSANNRIERSSPQSSTVVIKSEDVNDVNFAAFRKLTNFDITGTVKAEADWLASCEVVLALASSPQSVLKTMTVTNAFPFFEFSSLPAGKYVLYARVSLSTRSHDFESRPLHVALENHSDVVVEYTATPKQATQEPTQSSFFSVVLGVAAVALFLYKDQVGKAISKFREEQKRIKEATRSDPEKKAKRSQKQKQKKR